MAHLLGDILPSPADIAYITGAVILAVSAILGPFISARYITQATRKAATATAEFARQAAAAATAAQLATEQARTDASTAQRQATDAATHLIEVARSTDTQLGALHVLAVDTKTIAIGTKETTDNTHRIVNSDRTKMLGALAYALRRIADQNPTNATDQAAAVVAEQEALKAQVASAALEDVDARVQTKLEEAGR